MSNCPVSRGRYYILQEVTKIMISSEGYAWSKGRISVLPLKLAESQASA
jgi:hypothetical protein